MGQYFIIFNLTKWQSVEPAFANWKQGEFDWENVITVMGWEKSDDLRAYGDSGRVYGYINGEYISYPDHNFDQSGAEDETDGLSTPYERRYICNVKNITLDQPYDYQEFAKLLSEKNKKKFEPQN